MATTKAPVICEVSYLKCYFRTCLLQFLYRHGFGKKNTLAKEDYDTLSDTARKYVAMVKSTKKLKAEHDTAVQERDVTF